jgi:hypothetical protein
MKNTVILVLVLLVLLAILQRKQSNYPIAFQDTTSIRPSFLSNPGGGTTWVDIDPAAAAWTGYIVPAGIINSINLDNVKIDNINWLMWYGSNTLSTGTVITLPSGVLTTNVTGFRKRIQEDSNGPYGSTLQFLTKDPTGLMTRSAGVGATWVTPSARLSLPDYFIMAKSIYDPYPPQDCQYTATPGSCNSPCGNKAGNLLWTISGYNAASHDGVCAAFHGVNITGNGQYTSTDACNSPYCSFASGAQVLSFVDATPQLTCGPWQTQVGNACQNRQFKLAWISGGMTWWFNYTFVTVGSPTADFYTATTDPQVILSYDATRKVLTVQNAGDVYLASAGGTVRMYPNGAGPTPTTQYQWTPIQRGSNWEFKSDAFPTYSLGSFNNGTGSTLNSTTTNVTLNVTFIN